MYDMNLKKLHKEIDRYVNDLKDKDGFLEMFDFYRDIISVVLSFREKVKVDMTLDEDKIKELLREGHHLLSEESLFVDVKVFEELRDKITEAISLKDNDTGAVIREVWKDPAAAGARMIESLQQSGGFTPETLEKYFIKNNLMDKCKDSFELVSFTVLSALTPFYLEYARKAAEKTDFMLWSKGYCPVCAQKPLMAKIRKEDSARILECRVCHTNWGFPRLECPFCDNKDHKKMRYFFIDEVKGRKVNVCEKCKNYVKASILKELGREVVLDLENLATVQLDSVAQEEGYTPGKDFHPLN